MTTVYAFCVSCSQDQQEPADRNYRIASFRSVAAEQARLANHVGLFTGDGLAVRAWHGHCAEHMRIDADPNDDLPGAPTIRLTPVKTPGLLIAALVRSVTDPVRTVTGIFTCIFTRGASEIIVVQDKGVPFRFEPVGAALGSFQSKPAAGRSRPPRWETFRPLGTKAPSCIFPLLSSSAHGRSRS